MDMVGGSAAGGGQDRAQLPPCPAVERLSDGPTSAAVPSWLLKEPEDASHHLARSLSEKTG
jgi:hypothetical protein